MAILSFIDRYARGPLCDGDRLITEFTCHLPDARLVWIAVGIVPSSSRICA
jgi:hypothetical protein